MIKKSLYKKIEYFDSYFVTDKSSKDIFMCMNKCYGRVFKRDKINTFISFVDKKVFFIFKKSIKGLVIPTGCILGNQENFYIKIYNSFKLQEKLKVLWRDVVYFENYIPQDSSVMESCGALFENNKNYIILNRPSTVRRSPLPNKKHPEQDPEFYVIPKCLIINIEKYEN